ncbi:helix-turn-helix domain-containing protein [Parapedobacter luteus]|nr:helix-turn-helix domain-containing protein [Parapedobacter luteus]
MMSDAALAKKAGTDHWLNDCFQDIRHYIVDSIRKYDIAVATFDHNKQSPYLKEAIYSLETRSDIFCVALLLEGETTLQIDLEQFTFRENDVIIALPDASKSVTHIKSTAVIQLVAFSADLPIKLNIPEYFFDYIQYYFTSEFKPMWSLSKEEATHLKHVIDSLAYYLNRVEERTFGRDLLMGMFSVFMYELGALATTYAEPLPHTSSRKKQLFLSFYRLAKKYFRQHRDLTYYADRLFVTPKYLSEVVKELGGATATKVIETFVINEAKILLATPSLTIAQVSDMLNFSDQSFFGKYFKRMVGISPKAYRESRGTLEGAP